MRPGCLPFTPLLRDPRLSGPASRRVWLGCFATRHRCARFDSVSTLRLSACCYRHAVAHRLKRSPFGLVRTESSRRGKKYLATLRARDDARVNRKRECVARLGHGDLGRVLKMGWVGECAFEANLKIIVGARHASPVALGAGVTCLAPTSIKSARQELPDTVTLASLPTAMTVS